MSQDNEHQIRALTTTRSLLGMSKISRKQVIDNSDKNNHGKSVCHLLAPKKEEIATHSNENSWIFTEKEKQRINCYSSNR